MSKPKPKRKVKSKATEKLVPYTLKIAPSELEKLKARAAKAKIATSTLARYVLMTRKAEITVIEPLAIEQWRELADDMTAINKVLKDISNKEGFDAFNVSTRLEECRCILAQVRDHLSGRNPSNKKGWR